MNLTIATPEQAEEMIQKSSIFHQVTTDLKEHPWVSKKAFDVLDSEIYKSPAELGTTVAKILFPDRVNLILNRASTRSLQDFTNDLHIHSLASFATCYLQAVRKLSLSQRIFLQDSVIKYIDIDSQDRAISSFLRMGVVNYRGLLTILSSLNPKLYSEIKDFMYVCPHTQDSKSGYFILSLSGPLTADMHEFIESIPDTHLISSNWHHSIFLPQWVLDRYQPIGGKYNFKPTEGIRETMLSRYWDIPVFRKWGFRNPFPPKTSTDPILAPRWT